MSAKSTIKVSYRQRVGKIRHIHGTNVGPVHREGLIDLSEDFKDIRFPTVRLHDCPYAFRGTVDIPCIFPLFHLDHTKPEHYCFTRTDMYIQSIVDCGCSMVYRLGVSIQGNPQYRCDTDPPENYEKWAEICCNIIRHYNEGWADGFHHGIRYWEIWNEADIGPSQWTGPYEEYIAFYVATANIIKKAFPDLKIGGPAMAGMGGRKADLTEQFLRAVKKSGAPLDFFTWHYYAECPGEWVTFSKLVREILDKHGFSDTESHLNEWNLVPFGRDWKRMRSTPENLKAFFDYKNGPAGSALAASGLIGFQDAPLDMTNYYSSFVMNYGMHQAQGVPQKPFFAFRAYRIMLNETPNRLAVTGNNLDHGLGVLAGISGDENQVNLLLSNYNAETTDWTLRLVDLPWSPAKAVVMRLDAKYDLEKTGESVDISDGTLSLPVPRHSVCLVRLTEK